MPQNHYFDLSHFALLKISGEDASEFLENQLTTHLPDLEQQGWLLSAWCNPKGRVVANFLLFQNDKDYFLILPSMLKDSLLKRLSMYVLRSKVRIEDQQEVYALIGLQGSEIDSLLKQIDPELTSKSSALSCSQQITVLRFADALPRVLLVVSIEAMSHCMNQILLACHESDRSHWSLLDIESGIPWVTSATTETFLPQMLNLDVSGGLSYQKGCFPGQEIIARVHYRGEVKQRLHLGIGQGSVIPGPGDQLADPEDGKLIGDVIDAEPLDNQQFKVLASSRLQEQESYAASLRGQEATAVHLTRLNHQ